MAAIHLELWRVPWMMFSRGHGGRGAMNEQRALFCGFQETRSSSVPPVKVMR